MNPVSTLVLALALLFGGAGAVFAFESGAAGVRPGVSALVAPGTDGDPGALRPTGLTATPPRRGPLGARARPAHTLVDNACVTDVVKTVTLPAPAAQAVSHSSGTSAAHDDDEDPVSAVTTTAMTTATTRALTTEP